MNTNKVGAITFCLESKYIGKGNLWRGISSCLASCYDNAVDIFANTCIFDFHKFDYRVVRVYDHWLEPCDIEKCLVVDFDSWDDYIHSNSDDDDI